MARKVRYKAEDIWDLPDDGNTYEVIDGELYVSPGPKFSHQRAAGRLFIIIGMVVYRDHLGEIVTAPTGVVLDPESGVQPDILFIRRERASIISERGVEGAPDLVVEVLSPSTSGRDRGIKMRKYEAAGVPHYWIVDNDRRALEAYELGPDGYHLAGTYGPGTVLRSALFPGLDINLDDVWS